MINKYYLTSAPFTDCITGKNNTKVDNAKDLDVVMRTYDLIKYSDNHSGTTGIYCNIIKVSQEVP